MWRSTLLVHLFLQYPTHISPIISSGCSNEHCKVCSGALITEIVPRNPCHVHGASGYSKVVTAKIKPAVGSFQPPLIPSIFMKQKFNSGGRPPKINPASYRYVVRFDAAENSVFLSLYEKSGATNKAAFIKNVLLNKPFKVFIVDENTRIFIDQLSAFNSHYRTIGVEYDTVVKTLRENFTEKKAMAALYKLEKITIELVKLNREIVALANKFDERWLQKSL